MGSTGSGNFTDYEDFSGTSPIKEDSLLITTAEKHSERI